MAGNNTTHTYRRPVEPDGWRTLAACRSRDVDPEWFFSLSGEWDGALNRAKAVQAKQVCKSCPVTTACLAAAVAERDGHAIRGGLLPDERSRLRKAAS